VVNFLTCECAKKRRLDAGEIKHSPRIHKRFQRGNSDSERGKGIGIRRRREKGEESKELREETRKMSKGEEGRK